MIQIRARISGYEGLGLSQVGEKPGKKSKQQAVANECVSRAVAGLVAGGRLVRAAGFEPAADASQAIDNQSKADEVLGGDTQIRAQISDEDRRALARVVESWPRLGGGLKLAILAIIDAERGEGGGR